MQKLHCCWQRVGCWLMHRTLSTEMLINKNALRNRTTVYCIFREYIVYSTKNRHTWKSLILIETCFNRYHKRKSERQLSASSWPWFLFVARLHHFSAVSLREWCPRWCDCTTGGVLQHDLHQHVQRNKRRKTEHHHLHSRRGISVHAVL